MANSILDRVCFLLDKAKKGSCSKNELEKILKYAEQFSNDLILGRVFGYSVGAYAMATLRWIGDVETSKYFDRLYSNLTNSQKNEVNELILKKLYLQY